MHNKLTNPYSSEQSMVFQKSQFPPAIAETKIRRDLYGSQEVRKLPGAPQRVSTEYIALLKRESRGTWEDGEEECWRE